MDMSEILGNIYDRSGDCGNLFFDKKFVKILYYCFLFTQKLTELILEKLP